MENQSPALRGTDWNRLHAQLIWAYHDKPNQPRFQASAAQPMWWSTSPQWLNIHSTAWLLTRGSVRVTTHRGDVAAAHAGQWMFPMGRSTHEFSDEARIVSIAFLAHWPDNKPLYRHHRPVVCDASHFTELTKAGWALVRVSPTDGASDLPPTAKMRAPMKLSRYVTVARALWRWIRAYDQMMIDKRLTPTIPGEGDERVLLLQQRIDMMPLDEPFDAAAAAKNVGMSISQLNRIFVRKTGMTPHAYHQRRRLRFARDTLRETSTPIKQLAFMLNFQQPTSFSSWFRKNTGQYPRAFRNHLSSD